MSANDPERTLVRLRLLSERRSYLIGKSFLGIVKTRWPRNGHGALQQNCAEALSFWRLIGGPRVPAT